MRRPRRAGFSMVEMVAALAIFSIGVVGTMEAFTVCLRSSGASLDRTRAVFLAQGLIEQAVAEELILAGEESGEFGSELPGGSWTLHVTETEADGLYQVEATVWWPGRGTEKQWTLTTLIADR